MFELEMVGRLAIKYKTLHHIAYFKGLAKSGAGFQRDDDTSAEHIAQVRRKAFL